MARKKVDFTYEELVDEIVSIADMLDGDIYTNFGENFCLAIKSEHLISINGKSIETYRKATPEDIRKSMPAVHAYYAYNYALGNVMLDSGTEGGGDGWFLDAVDVFYTVFMNKMKWISDSKYILVHDLGIAREQLDDGRDLSISDLALLAGVDERTIRNSASSKDENSLSIEKFGGSTIIKNSEAIRWLSRRPDFKKTQYVGDDPSDSPRYFINEIGFGSFISFKRNELSLTVEMLAHSLNVDSSVITDLENGVDRLNLRQVKKLANILEEDEKVLVNDYMRIFHLEELANLLGASTDKFQLAFFKSKLNMESELEVFNWQKKRQEFQETEK